MSKSKIHYQMFYYFWIIISKWQKNRHCSVTTQRKIFVSISTLNALSRVITFHMMILSRGWVLASSLNRNKIKWIQRTTYKPCFFMLLFKSLMLTLTKETDNTQKKLKTISWTFFFLLLATFQHILNKHKNE